MINEATQKESICSLIETFSLSFGCARVAIYIFPELSDYSLFARYLNTFLCVLRRYNCRPVYSWSYDSNKRCYKFILIVNGYFRRDVQDITDTAKRIWLSYSAEPIQFIADIPVSSHTLQYDEQRILDVLSSTSYFPQEPQRILNPHQRSFACSRVF